MSGKFKNFFDNFDRRVIDESKGELDYPARELKSRWSSFYWLIDSIYFKVFSEKRDEESLFYYTYVLLRFFKDELNFSVKDISSTKLLDSVKLVEKYGVKCINTQLMKDIYSFLKGKIDEDVLEEGVDEFKNLFEDALLSIVKSIEREFFKDSERDF